MKITVNQDRAVEALAIIETYPERHQQASWRADFGELRGRVENFFEDPLNPACETAFCLGGWIVALDHLRWAVGQDGYPLSHLVEDPRRCKCPPEQRYCDCGHFMSVGTYAALRLGITTEEGDALFGSDNSVDDLRAGVKALMNDEDICAVIADQYAQRLGDDE